MCTSDREKGAKFQPYETDLDRVLVLIEIKSNKCETLISGGGGKGSSSYF